ncbi:hypothetical protein [Tessaracoccus lacteus]|uniref:Uncharacterized protein n=1 Tax=Tessaracoccus lacteus TaxID=3041766 RepID=A0ABY8PY39_9ACTN|nr:hypothetical protein [Tessaracoccus sp. T21]WGT47291.1 hypothetical protein QH948_00450 [Tessaracoccus sp. T21]
MTQQVERMLPLYEAKMLSAYDHRDADVVKSATAAKRQNQPRYLTDQEHLDPQREAIPNVWIREELVDSELPEWLTGFSDVTSSTNERTIISAALPRAGVGHTYPLYFASAPHLLLAQWNSFVVDFMARQKVAGLHLTYTYLRQLPLLPPSRFEGPCPWTVLESLRDWFAQRVVVLSCTSESMKPMAMEIRGVSQVNPWDPALRISLMAELDAALFQLFGVTRDDLDYIMESFPIVKRKDVAAHGTFRTKDMILEVYDAMQVAIDTGTPYRSALQEELA